MTAGIEVVALQEFTVQRGRGDGGPASLFEEREPPLGCDALSEAGEGTVLG